MKISIVKVPSRYERIEVDERLEKLKEFLERRSIESKLDEDEVSAKLEIKSKLDKNPITVRPGYIIYICNDMIASVDIPEFPEYDEFFRNLQKIKNQF